MKLTMEDVYGKYADRVFAAAFSVCRNQADADDTVQDTFIKYDLSGQDFTDEEHIKAWLLRVAINRAKDIRASFWRRNKVSWEEYMAELAFEEPEDSRLFEAVMSLPDKYRTVIHLYYYEEYSVSEISSILHSRDGTVKSQLSRGRSLLKKHLWRNGTMTNKEKYQRTFRTLHASDKRMEVREMKKTKHLSAARFIPAAAALVLVLGLATAAYATDFGGIRRTIQLWIHGNQTNAVMEVEDGSYSLTYTDEHGNTVERGGGGVALEPGGEERPLTADELMENLYSPEVEFKEDGTVWVYYYDQAVEVTNQFEDGICYVKLDDHGKALYMTIRTEANGGYGYSTSPNDYPDPKKLG